eukprot:SAG25_NODE_11578_length_301_cov_0.707921_1_plen_38_part_10
MWMDPYANKLLVTVVIYMLNSVPAPWARGARSNGVESI